MTDAAKKMDAGKYSDEEGTALIWWSGQVTLEKKQE